MTEEMMIYFAGLTVDDLPEVVDAIYEAMTEGKTVQEQEEISAALLTLGVDVKPLCRKKHPA